MSDKTSNKSLQKYLRKYMSKEDKKSQKKIKIKIESNEAKKNLWKVVDDDIDMKKIKGGDHDLMDLELGEDAPQIAGIIDERPLTIQAEERFGSYKWKSIVENEENTKKIKNRSKKPRKSRNDSDSDERRHSSDESPPRNREIVIKREKIDSDDDLSPQRVNTKKMDEDLSPVRMKDDEKSVKMTKTLDGKAAGLQLGSSVRDEVEKNRRKEDEFFEKMDKSVSGRDAATVVRSKGRKVDLKEKERKEREKKERQAEREAKYLKWGKGLKQIEMSEEKRESELKEMDKPLARYADDADLDKYLREQERDGDPMLKFIKKKKTQVNTVGDTVPDDGKPKYQGSAPPNRYKIRPGFRWDGVDRSNGFERDRFTRLANRQAAETDVYKWSIEDM